jgi:serine/threonine-protein kinase
LPEASPRWCATLRAAWGATLVQLAGCALTTADVRPYSAAFLERCPPAARATPLELGFKPRYLYATYMTSGTPASSALPREEGGPLNVKPGPVTAIMVPFEQYGDDREFNLEGEAKVTPMRVYIRFNRIQRPDGTWLPICGAAVSSWERVYGIPTYDGFPMADAPLDQVDRGEGSVIINWPRFETAIMPPEGEPLPDVPQVDPNAQPQIRINYLPKRQRY